MDGPCEFNRLKNCRHGRMLYNVNDAYIGRSLDLYGEYSEGEMELLGPLIRRGDFVIDVGANIGAHTIFFAKMTGPEGVVLGFEPQRLVFQTLCANVALNSLTQVWCFNMALGDTSGTIRVPGLDPRRASNFGGLGLESNAQGEGVTLATIDAFPIPRCRLIKIDVEGMELQVLKGAVGIISRFRPALYVENDRPQHSAELIHSIVSLGYDLYWHRTPLFNPDNYCKNPDNAFGDIISANMLCIPKEAPGGIMGLPRVEIPGT